MRASRIRGVSEVILILLSRRLRAEPLRVILAVISVTISTALGLALYLATAVSDRNFLAAVGNLGKFDAKVELSSEDVALAIRTARAEGLEATVVFEEGGTVSGKAVMFRGVISQPGQLSSIAPEAIPLVECKKRLGDEPAMGFLSGKSFQLEQPVLQGFGPDCSIFVDAAIFSSHARTSIYLSCLTKSCENSLINFSSSSVAQRGWRVQSVSARQAALSLAAAFTTNIYLLLVVAALIAAFTIWNSFEISISSARRDYQALTTIGFPSGAIYLSLVVEGAIIGAFGGALAIACFPLVTGIYEAVHSVIAMHYATILSDDNRASLSLAVCFWAVAAATISTLIGAHLPALKAASLSASVIRGRSGGGNSQPSRWLWALAIGVLLVALGFLSPQRKLAGEILALGVLAIGMGAIPSVIKIIAEVFSKFSFGLLAAGELRASAASAARTTLFLYVAFALTTALGVMVSSFRRSVDEWLTTTFTGDLYIKAETGELTADLVDTVFQLIGTGSASVRIVSLRQRPLLYEGALIEVQGQELDSALQLGAISIIKKTADSSWSRFAGISEPFARKFGKSLGDLIEIAGRQFKISFVARDYSSDRGTVYLDVKSYSEIFNTDELRSLSLYGISPDIVSALRTKIADGRHAVSVNDPRELKGLVFEIFDKTFRITDIIGMISVVLAQVGFAFTAIQLAIERRVVLLTLTMVGANRRQVASMLCLTYFAQVAIAAGLGVLSGGALGWVLAVVINPRYFGWSIEFRLDAASLIGVPGYMLVVCLGIAVTAAVLESYMCSRNSNALEND